MRILVCVKQGPDAAEVRLNEDFTIQREGAAHRMNPADESALELGLSLRDTHGGRVTVLTMGPAQAAGMLRETISRGADSAFEQPRLCGQRYAGHGARSESCRGNPGRL